MPDTPAHRYPSRIVIGVVIFLAYVLSKSLWFIRYRGLENIPDPLIGGFIVASNHQTYIDPAWICPPLQHRKFGFMAWDRAFEWGVIGPLIKYMGAFPVSDRPSGSLDAIKESMQALKDGAALVIFPEGGREKADGKILSFRTGAVRIAHHARVPILPVTIMGGNRIWPPGRRFPRLFRRIEIRYHPLLKIPDAPDPELHDPS